MEGIIAIFIRIIVVLVLLAVIWLVYKACSYFGIQIKMLTDAELDKLIDDLTSAAEQMYHDKDPTGSVRLNYVKSMLIDAGYDLSKAVLAKIEGYVYRINMEVKNE